MCRAAVRSRFPPAFAVPPRTSPLPLPFVPRRRAHSCLVPYAAPLCVIRPASPSVPTNEPATPPPSAVSATSANPPALPRAAAHSPFLSRVPSASSSSAHSLFISYLIPVHTFPWVEHTISHLYWRRIYRVCRWPQERGVSREAGPSQAPPSTSCDARRVGNFVMALVLRSSSHTQFVRVVRLSSGLRPHTPADSYSPHHFVVIYFPPPYSQLRFLRL